MKPAWLLGAALALFACAGDLASPFSAVAVTYDVNKKAFKLAQVRIDTLTSLRHLQGSSAVVTAGGSVRVSEAAVTAKGATVDSLRASFIVARPAQVQIAWSVLNDIVYPEDFDSLELLSSYYNLEKARKALGDWGLSTLPAKPAVAHASLTDDSGLRPLGDGELYYLPLATFYLPAATPQAQVPASFNLGAVAHALGHEAVEETVWKGAPAPAPELGPPGDPDWNSARHVARSMAEGIADYFGVAASGDPRWFDHSVQQGAATRALDGIRCSSPDMLEALPADDSQAPYNPYPLGTVLAGALWEASAPQDSSHVQVAAQGVVAALPGLAQRAQDAQGKLTVAAVLDALVASSTLKADLCGLFYNRFLKLSVQKGDLPSCAQVTPTPHTECQ